MQPFRILSFNVAGQLRFGWEQRSHLIAEVLKQARADVIGFQEFGITNWNAYTPALPNHELYSGFIAGDIFINPIAWDARRFTMLECKTTWLSETPEVFSKGWDGSERGASWVKLKEKTSGKILFHVNVHLDNLGEKARVEGTRQIIALIEEKTKEADGIIITGDFNCSPFAPHERATYSRKPYDLLLAAGFTDAWRSLHPEDAPVPTTFHDYAGAGYVADQYATWHTDWIMTRCLAVKNYEILVQDPPFPSDHYPILADLVFDEATI